MSTTYGPGRFDAIVNRSITEIESNVKTVGQYAFYGCTQLTSAAFPNATSVGDYAFYGCTTLEDLHLPKVTSLSGTYNFQNCYKLTEIPVPNNLDFYNNRGIFQGCRALQTVHIVGTCTQDMFNWCTGLTTAVMRSSTLSVWNRTFQNCSKLETADIHGSGIQYTVAFQNCSMLKTVIIRRTTVQDLGYAADNGGFAFIGTPFASGGTGGTIYIPKVLYDHLGDGTSYDYKAAAKWATVDALGTITWAQIEGSQYENYYADGTPIT